MRIYQRNRLLALDSEILENENIDIRIELRDEGMIDTIKRFLDRLININVQISITFSILSTDFIYEILHYMKSINVLKKVQDLEYSLLDKLLNISTRNLNAVIIDIYDIVPANFYHLILYSKIGYKRKIIELLKNTNLKFASIDKYRVFFGLTYTEIMIYLLYLNINYKHRYSKSLSKVINNLQNRYPRRISKNEYINII